MENSLDKNWKDLVVKLSHRFGEGLDLQAVLFLIGLQELGQGYQKLTKNQKLDVIHVAVYPSNAFNTNRTFEEKGGAADRVVREEYAEARQAC